MSVSATGNNVEYSLVGGNAGNTFTMTKNGNLMLTKALDAENVNVYNLVVRAIEPATPLNKVAEKVFVINVKDLNDNVPVFAVKNPEKEVKIYIDRFSPEGTIIQRVST